MHLLGLDLGTRRTGVAFADTVSGFIVALDTISHKDIQELCTKLKGIIEAKKISELIIGLPRLLDGTEGSQSEIVRGFAEVLETTFMLPVTFIDERFSSMDATKKSADAKAACSILEVVISQRKNQY